MHKMRKTRAVFTISSVLTTKNVNKIDLSITYTRTDQVKLNLKAIYISILLNIYHRFAQKKNSKAEFLANTMDFVKEN